MLNCNGTDGVYLLVYVFKINSVQSYHIAILLSQTLTAFFFDNFVRSVIIISAEHLSLFNIETLRKNHFPVIFYDVVLVKWRQEGFYGAVS